MGPCKLPSPVSISKGHTGYVPGKTVYLEMYLEIDTGDVPGNWYWRCTWRKTISSINFSRYILEMILARSYQRCVFVSYHLQYQFLRYILEIILEIISSMIWQNTNGHECPSNSHISSLVHSMLLWFVDSPRLRRSVAMASMQSRRCGNMGASATAERNKLPVQEDEASMVIAAVRPPEDQLM